MVSSLQKNLNLIVACLVLSNQALQHTQQRFLLSTDDLHFEFAVPLAIVRFLNIPAAMDFVVPHIFKDKKVRPAFLCRKSTNTMQGPARIEKGIIK